MRGVSLLALIVGLVACAAPRPPDSGGLSGDWELVAGIVDETHLTPIDGYRVTLSFDGTAIGGTAACNGYFGTFTADDGHMTVSGIGSTEMACSPVEIMELEALYLDALPRVTAFTIEGELALSGDGVVLSFNRLPPMPVAQITDTVWVLDGLVQGESVSTVMGERATLELFTDGSLLGSTGCRTLNGHYVVERAQVKFTDFSAVGECESDLQAQDGHVVTVLGDGFRAEVDAQTLTITSAGELGLIYRAES